MNKNGETGLFFAPPGTLIIGVSVCVISCLPACAGVREACSSFHLLNKIFQIPSLQNSLHTQPFIVIILDEGQPKGSIR